MWGVNNWTGSDVVLALDLCMGREVGMGFERLDAPLQMKFDSGPFTEDSPQATKKLPPDEHKVNTNQIVANNLFGDLAK